MSKDPQADYNFWQCVACVICHLPFSTPSGPTVPFWLTECGHVICNNHLKADQSCARCASEGIQLVPLQQEMDAPMADWFRPVAASLDTVAFAAKFQFESMAAQLHYHKNRHQQLRVFIDRLKREIVDLKKSNDTLIHENQRLRQHISGFCHREVAQQPSSMPNIHGKRPMTEYQQLGSSPRSATTPVAPNRLTLPAGHAIPNFTSYASAQADRNSEPSANSLHYKPGSESFQNQYSYKAPTTPLQNRVHVTNVDDQHSQSNAQGRMKLLPSFNKFKPAPPASMALQAQCSDPAPKHQPMGPPPVPRDPQTDQGARHKSFQPSAAANRPSEQSHIGFSYNGPPTSAGPQRFVPQSNRPFPQRSSEFRGASSRGFVSENNSGAQQMSFNTTFQKFG